MQSINFKDLEKSGFVVVPDFLNQSKINNLLSEYSALLSNVSIDEAKTHQSYGKNGSAIFSPSSLMRDDMNGIFDLINKNTNICVDFVPSRGEFLDTKIVDLIWHQDHTTYYKWQNLYDSVTFWIPLIKPDVNLSGLSFVPHDVLAELNPNFAKNSIFGKGAKHFNPRTTYTEVIDDETDKETTIPFNLNEIAVSPKIGVGDLLLFRGDMIHKTQDVTTSRVAISIHCANSKGIVTKEKFYSGGVTKRQSIEKYPNDFKWLTDQFETNDTATIG